MKGKVNRAHIGQQLLTTIGNNHLESEVFDGFYVEGPHALKFGAILQDKTETYRLYYSFDGVGIDIIEDNIHIILTTSNNGTPFHQYLWLFIGQNSIRQIFDKETISEDNRIRISHKMMKENGESIGTFERHISKIMAFSS
ncbi:hypothetical protein D8Y20_01465 [Mariprofundus sp. EBB-1]|uniref:hypothetical protein n=1 Tax=Mariprofundus sp. EBB-1 TaxID=2650971 RepID=UPI000EF260CD|nr:hypothetical protein [Mariprofundus sp. EBB-1]RLL55597.1 hypothetical protein D8Y20_01465 [Mariprofundus sp. EBB-1]